MTSGQGQQEDPREQRPQWPQPGPPPHGQPGQPPYGQPGQPPYGQPGQPPYGQPGPPPYGQPPYGQPGQPPYGQPGQPPWGYAPAPGFGQPPPEPKDRPLSVRAGLGAFIASIVLSLAGSVLTFANWDRYVDEALAQQPQFEEPELQEAGLDPQTFVEGLAVFFVVLSLVFTALYVLFVWFAWRGYNWARIVLFVLGGLGIAGGLLSLAGAGSSPFPSLTALSLFSFLAVLVGVVLLARKESGEWFAHEKWRRSLSR